MRSGTNWAWGPSFHRPPHNTGTSFMERKPQFIKFVTKPNAMSNQFITVRGTACIEGEQLVIRNWKPRGPGEVYWICFQIFLVIWIIRSDSQVRPLAYVSLLVVALLLLVSLFE